MEAGMFTGIVEETGEIASFERHGNAARLVVRAKKALEGTVEGDSISIDGVCQTVVEFNSNSFSVDVLAESLKKTTLGLMRKGQRVNLERALASSARFGGHIVQGHVHCVVPIRSLREEGANAYLCVEVPQSHLKYCVAEGSIALDGMSLTIARLEGALVTINIIPATMRKTSLGTKKTGGVMNLETDIVARYVERFVKSGALCPEAPDSALNMLL
ncbi:MAG: riboflavin synthase [Spirochaetaceae bacterium]|jgi:riboflavin synthase|nr:riboflavin synthase [Spirochaetaceae bacterium]